MIRCRSCGSVLKSSGGEMAVVSTTSTTSLVGDLAEGGLPVEAVNRQKSAQKGSSVAAPVTAGAEQEKQKQKLTIKCSCGFRMQVPVHSQRRRWKCSGCGAMVGAAVPEVAPRQAEPVTAAQKTPREQTHEWWLSVVSRAAKQEPRQSVEPDLRIALGASAWRRLSKIIENGTGSRGEHFDAFRSAVEELERSQDERASELLISLLASENRMYQQLVAKALGELRDPAAGVPLLKLLDSDLADVRTVAYASLTKLADARWVDVLLLRARHRPEQAIACEQAIVACGANAVRPLLRHLTSADDDIVMRAVEALGRVPDKSAVSRLVPLLEHRNPAIRSMTVRAIGQIGDRGSVDMIAMRLQDPDRVVRVRAASALASLAGPKQIPRLVDALEDEIDEVRERMATTLGALGHRAATGALLAHVEDPSVRVRIAALDALGKIGDPDAARTLLRLVDQPDETIRERAVAAMRKISVAEVQEKLLELLDDPSALVRARAVDGVGAAKQKNSECIDRLIAMLKKDEHPEVRRALLTALGLNKVRKAVPLIETLIHGDLEVQADAIRALGEIGDVSALPALLAMLKDNRAMVRYHASQALSKLGHKNALKPLEALLSDEDSLVRHGAAKALVDLGDPRGEKLLELGRQPLRRSFWTTLKNIRFGSEEGEISIRKVGLGLSVTVVVVCGLVFTTRGLMNAHERSINRGRLTSVCYSEDGKTIVVGRNTGGLVEIWDVDTGTVRQRETLAEGGIDAVALAPDGKRVLAFSSKVGGVLGGEQKQQAPGHANGIKYCISTPDRKFTLTCGVDGSVYIWDMASCEATRTLRVAATDLSAIAISPDGKLVASGNGGGQVAVWEGTPAVTIAEFKLETRILSMVFSPDSTQLVLADPKQGLTIVDPRGINAPIALKKESAAVPIYTYLFFLPDGRLLALESGRADLWNLETKTSTSIASLGGKADVVSLAGDGSMLVFGDREESAVHVFDIKSGQVTKSLDVQ